MRTGYKVAVVRQFIDALSGQPKPESVVQRYIAESDEALRRHILHYEVAFPCFELDTKDVFVFGGCVLAHLVMRGIHRGDLWYRPPVDLRDALPLRPTHNGEFTGLAPTGRTIALPMTALFRVEGNQIVEHRMRYDADHLLRQLDMAYQQATYSRSCSRFDSSSG